MILRGTVFSQVLEMDTIITVVAPTKLKAGGNHKVVYLLHGLCGDANNWVDFTRLPAYANEHDFIFILPSVGRSFYTDMKFGPKYFSYVVDELPKFAQTLFNISAKPEDTILMGGSMGGYGALKAALARPEQYGVCCAFSSGSLFMAEWLEDIRKDKPKAKNFYGRMIDDLEAMYGENLSCGDSDDLLDAAKRVSGHSIKPRIYMSCGKEDYLLELNQRFAQEMEKLDYHYTYEEISGTHDWEFFDRALKRALEWISSNQ